ncbi:unnamed protein product [Phaeothamnion confervicola]
MIAFPRCPVDHAVEASKAKPPPIFTQLQQIQQEILVPALHLSPAATPEGLESREGLRGSRITNERFSGAAVSNMRVSYLQAPGIEVFSSAVYPTCDVPVLGVSAMLMGPSCCMVAVDFQPLLRRAAADADDPALAPLLAIKRRHPRLQQPLVRDTYRGSPFFSDGMLYARFANPVADLESEVLPAFREAVEAYAAVVAAAPLPSADTAVAVRRRISEFDAFHAEREQAHSVVKASFGEAWANQYIERFLYPHACLLAAEGGGVGGASAGSGGAGGAVVTALKPPEAAAAAAAASTARTE